MRSSCCCCRLVRNNAGFNGQQQQQHFCLQLERGEHKEMSVWPANRRREAAFSARSYLKRRRSGNLTPVLLYLFVFLARACFSVVGKPLHSTSSMAMTDFGLSISGQPLVSLSFSLQKTAASWSATQLNGCRCNFCLQASGMEKSISPIDDC